MECCICNKKGLGMFDRAALDNSSDLYVCRTCESIINDAKFGAKAPYARYMKLRATVTDKKILSVLDNMIDPQAFDLEIPKAPEKTDEKKAVYSIDGVRGRHIDIYEDKCVISVRASLGSFITGNISDGEKTIYYRDCIGVQFKKSGFQIGYLQLETASGLMNNRNNNFFNENSFTFDTTVISNEEMEKVAAYVKKRVEAIKSGKADPVPGITSPADEIKKYKELLDLGIISQEEFEIKKKQLLSL